MELKELIMLSFVCAMGAISPGPSLAVVIRNTISGGRFQGVMTGIGHGIGIGIYAFMAVMGLSSLLLNNEKLFMIFQIAGAIILLWIACKMILNKPSDVIDQKQFSKKGFIQGFMIFPRGTQRTAANLLRIFSKTRATTARDHCTHFAVDARVCRAKIAPNRK